MQRSTQARYWIATTASHHGTDVWAPTEQILQHPITYVKGQLEIGDNGFEHWQFIIYCKNKIRRGGLKELLPSWSHLEITRSDAAEAYVWKEETRVPDTQFEYGRKAGAASDKTDWDEVRRLAEAGEFEQIPSAVLVRLYGNITRLRTDNIIPADREKISVNVYWGVTGSGKTYRAYDEAKRLEGGFFRKSSTTKWWDSYRGEKNILIDEFDGHSIGITHFLQWLDPYPMSVEVKGGTVSFSGTNFWITSNVDPEEWWMDAKPEHRRAFLRRCRRDGSQIIHFAAPYEEWANLQRLMGLLD